MREEDVSAIEPTLTPYVSSLTHPADGGALDVRAPGPSPEEDADEHACAERRRSAVARGLAVLNPRERLIVERRLLEDEPESLGALGRTLAVSRERVRQIESRAREKLRAEILHPEALL